MASLPYGRYGAEFKNKEYHCFATVPLSEKGFCDWSKVSRDTGDTDISSNRGILTENKLKWSQVFGTQAYRFYIVLPDH